MSSVKLEIGDIVQLKSGGYKMTIQNIDINDMAECVYLNENKEQRTDYYHVKTLNWIDPNESSVWVMPRPNR